MSSGRKTAFYSEKHNSLQLALQTSILPIPDWAVYSRAQKGRRNQWHSKPLQTRERDTGLQPVFLWRCSRSRWKQGFEEALCSGGDTHGLESKWLIFEHAYEKCVCVWVLNLECSLWWACKCESSTVCLTPFYVPACRACTLRSLVQLRTSL